MKDQEISFQHPITCLDYPSESETVDELIPFLDQELRPKSKHSIKEEYPSLFGDFPGGSSLYIKKDGRVASHVAFVTREFLHPEFRLRIGLIGSVATASIFRGMGMASTLLKSALQDLRSKRCALAVLWSDQGEFYLPLGFHRAGREVDLKFDPGQIPDLAEGSRLFNSATDTEGIWRLYQRHELKIDRSLEEMKRLTRIPETKIYVTEKNGAVSSYIAIGKGADFTNYIHEWGGELEAVAKNIAFTQKKFFTGIPLVLIAPSSMDLTPVKQLSTDRWEGVVGLVKIMDRGVLLRAYTAFLKNRKIDFMLREGTDVLELGEHKYPIKTDKELLKVVLGDDSPTRHTTLPFFLWGFDSI